MRAAQPVGPAGGVDKVAKNVKNLSLCINLIRPAVAMLLMRRRERRDGFARF